MMATSGHSVQVQVCSETYSEGRNEHALFCYVRCPTGSGNCDVMSGTSRRRRACLRSDSSANRAASCTITYETSSRLGNSLVKAQRVSRSDRGNCSEVSLSSAGFVPANFELLRFMLTKYPVMRREIVNEIIVIGPRQACHHAFVSHRSAAGRCIISLGVKG